jgi:hypothetical protein
VGLQNCAREFGTPKESLAAHAAPANAPAHKRKKKARHSELWRAFQQRFAS